MLGGAVAAAGLGACGSDTPALTGPSQQVQTPTTAAAAGPTVGVVAVGAVEAPVVSGGAAGSAITAAGRAVATRLSAAGRTCPMRVVASTPAVVSLRWDCTDHTVATATFATATGRQLQLPDLLQGDWVAYLSTTAQAQLEAGGATAVQAAAAAPAAAGAYGRWNVTAADLQVVCTLPAGPVTVSFPRATLTPYLRPGVA